ncbi:uncharacterized protein LOC144123075 [Amblyomma americanum]
MAETYGEDLLRPMSAKNLSLRSELMQLEGVHLIYNIPLSRAGFEHDGPSPPLPGLCIAFLVYMPKAKAMFDIIVAGTYSIGFNANGLSGLFGNVKEPGDRDGGSGYNNKKHEGFEANTYHYIYFYFPSKTGFQPCIDDLPLKANYPVQDLPNSKTIKLGLPGYHEVQILEVHWVPWNGLHNSDGSPSPSIMDAFWNQTRNSSNKVDFTASGLLAIRSGSIITVQAKSIRKQAEKHRFMAMEGYTSEPTKLPYQTKLRSQDENVVMKWTRVNVSDSSVFAQFTPGIEFVRTGISSHTKSAVAIRFDAIEPVRVFVETMGDII